MLLHSTAAALTASSGRIFEYSNTQTTLTTTHRYPIGAAGRQQLLLIPFALAASAHNGAD